MKSLNQLQVEKISDAVNPCRAVLVSQEPSCPVCIEIRDAKEISRLKLSIYGGPTEEPLSTTRQVNSIMRLAQENLWRRGLIS